MSALLPTLLLNFSLPRRHSPVTLSTADLQRFVPVPLGGDAKRLPSASQVWVYTDTAWAGNVQLEVATPRSMAAGVWLALESLQFTENGYASIPGDLYVRAINNGAPGDVQIELTKGNILVSSAGGGGGGSTPSPFTAYTNVSQEFTKQQNFNATTLADGANIAWDVDNNQVASVTLAGNRTLDNPTNFREGSTYILIVKQDATGGRTLAFGSAYKWSGGTAPELSSGANAIDILTFVCDGTNMLGVLSPDFQ